VQGTPGNPCVTLHRADALKSSRPVLSNGEKT
jgi:hypothetical protein